MDLTSILCYTIVCTYMHTDVTQKKGLLNIEQFLEMYNISRGKFYSEVNKKNLKIKKLGSRTYILPEEAEKWAINLPDGE